MKRVYLFILLTVSLIIQKAEAQSLPEIGAQVFIEPGQTKAETELWFKTLHANGMPLCRIRMFESYMKQEDGTWDFSLFDRAFEMAEKYNIKVIGTFFPATDKTDIGGWKFPKDEAQLNQFAEYIKQMTLHFKQYNSLYSWVLINEMGGGHKDTPFARKMREKWNQINPPAEFLDNGYPVLVDLQDGRFKRYMTSWMLNWIANQVRKYDKDVHLHENSHSLFTSPQEYDFPYWRTFLNSFGGSSHPSWHFGMFERKQFTLAMSANSEILRSGAGDLPWLMTEIQGGNNTYSAYNPICPTAEEITQWLWTIIATEGKGGIFWSLNARGSGVEAGEWALLNFQQKPTERMESARKVAECIRQNPDVFSNLKTHDSGINLLYLKESLWAEQAITHKQKSAIDGRRQGLKGLLGYFKALSEIGVNANIKAFEEYDFTKDDYTGESIVLANQIAIAEAHIQFLERFVKLGGKLLIDGLTGYYNEHLHNWLLSGFPLQNLFGGTVAEYIHLPQNTNYDLRDIPTQIPGCGWKGYLVPNRNTETIASDGNHVLATRSTFGKGEVIWVPSLLGIAAWENSEPLAKFMQKEFVDEQKLLMFQNHQEDVLMKTLKAGNDYLSLIINKSASQESIKLGGKLSELEPELLFHDSKGTIMETTVDIQAEETMLIQWKRK